MTQGFVVFVVDDDESVRDSLRDLLEAHQYRVVSYASGQAFLKEYEEGTWPEGCLVLDLDLPGIDGLKVIRLLAQRKIKLPIVVITGRTAPSYKALAYAAGASAYLEKPFTHDALLAAIDGTSARLP